MIVPSAITLFTLFGGVFAAHGFRSRHERGVFSEGLPAAHVGRSLGPITDLHIMNAYIQPDGYNRSAVLAEGVYPGPVIRAVKDDVFQINVINELTDDTMRESTTLHWHGLFQKTTAWADGTASVTQCPIGPGDSFLYEFMAPGQVGTYWYHSHLSTQYCDGLRGALIIDDPNDPYQDLYDVDDDTTVLTLSDWYHLPASQNPPIASVLINGLGRQVSTPNGTLAVVNVQQGTRYRFRLLSFSCEPSFAFSIDGHSFTIIEVEGVNVVPVKADSIVIYAGQRYSFILVADQAIDNYWIRSDPAEGPSGFDKGINSAILRYSGAATLDPVTLPSVSKLPLLETSLVPLDNAGAPGAPDVDGADVSLTFLIDYVDEHYRMNGVAFDPPSVPVLLQILSGTTSASQLMPNGSMYSLPPNKVIQISIPGGGAASPHPFHLHGHNFDVIRSVGSTTYNYVNPPRRDVVNTGNQGDNVTIRFVTDNAGPWFLHCHMDWHLDAGLAVVLVEDIDDISMLDPTPDSWSSLCPTYDSLDPSQQ